MAVDSFSLLALFGVTIIVGYIGYLFFGRTKIPDIAWLIVIGVVIGPVFNLVDRSVFLAISPFLTSLALLVILFQAGIGMDFYQYFRNFRNHKLRSGSGISSRGILLAVVGVALAMGAVTAVGLFLMGLGLAYSLLLAAIVSGISSEIVVALVNRLGVSQQSRSMMTLESMLTDPITIAVAIVMLNIIAGSGAAAPLTSVVSSFFIGAVAGILAGLFVGLFWLFFMDRFKGRPFDYMLTIAVLFLLYALVESTIGSGILSAIVFGVVLGNGRTFSHILKTRKLTGFDRLLRSFHAEITFFIRAFFFVYIGLIVSINPAYMIYGMVIVAVLILSRYVAVHLSTYGTGMTRLERNLAANMAPRGLTTAALAQLAVIYGIPNAPMVLDIVFVVILSTVIYTTIATWVLYRSKTLRKEHIEEIRSRGEREQEKEQADVSRKRAPKSRRAR